jgi:hypothetical protein
MQEPFTSPAKWILAGTITLLLLYGMSGPFLGYLPSARAESLALSAEGRDFATLRLRDPWDMQQFSDVSQALNSSGQADYLQDIQVADGIFSATSTDAKDAQFFALWPGYYTAMLLGKVGHNYPIESDDFKCLYLGMKVSSGAAGAGGPDQFQVMWFADERLNGAGGTWGYSKAFPLYPEAGSAAPSATWKLYKVDLSSSANHLGGASWSSRDSWQGLRIDPTIQANTKFEVDWVRLTDCTPVSQPVTWNGGQSASVWVRPEGTSRDFLAASGVSGSSYALDVQGMPPGSYDYTVNAGSQILGSGSFLINQMPIASFSGLSPLDGLDFAGQAGNPWDFTDSADALSISDMSYSFGGGVLDMVTAGGGGTDAIIQLNDLQDMTESSAYYYLVFRMYTEGAFQNVPQGMIARWVWTIPGSGTANSLCYLVSNDIPLDVGWHVYTIDLRDAFNGSAEEYAGKCDGLPTHWMDTSPVVKFRFDPNENILASPMHQKLDWIRLIKPRQVVQGQAFPIQISLNKAPGDGLNATFYYTDDLSDPTKYPASGQMGPGALPASAPATAPTPSPAEFQAKALPVRAYIPVVTRNFYQLEFPPVENGVNFSWNTASVAPGEYYPCVLLEDELNQATYCSEAPVKVLP